MEDIFRKRGFVMKSIPFCFLRGPCRVALRVALTESVAADPRSSRARLEVVLVVAPHVVVSESTWWIGEQRDIEEEVRMVQ